MTRPMTVAEREEFLAAPRVAVVAVADPDGGSPLAVPIWYHPQPCGEIMLLTLDTSRKAVAIRAAGRLTLCVHDDSPPYRYVSMSGLVTEIRDTVTPAEECEFASRYLGPEGGERHVARFRGAPWIAIRIRPERWLTQDQAG